MMLGRSDFRTEKWYTTTPPLYIFTTAIIWLMSGSQFDTIWKMDRSDPIIKSIICQTERENIKIKTKVDMFRISYRVVGRSETRLLVYTLDNGKYNLVVVDEQDEFELTIQLQSCSIMIELIMITSEIWFLFSG